MRSRELSSEIAQLLAECEELRGKHAPGDGWSVVRRLSDAVDRAVTGLWRRLAPPEPASLVAVGGYGRRELSPASDIDLMVLHAGGSSVAPAAEALFYQLWDSGMQVGHSIRTRREALKLAATDLDAETAFLDARLVAGDEEMFETFAEQTLEETARGSGFMDRITAATHQRHQKAGDASGALEPNLKDGRGGLRDYHTLRWLSRVYGRSEAYDADLVTEAVGYLHLVRTALHEITGRHTDTLAVQWQSPVAAALAAGEHGPATVAEANGDAAAQREDFLMRRLYERCRTIAFALECVLHPEHSGALGKLPASLLEGRWTEEGRRAFLDLLASGEEAGPALRALDQSGVLVALLPGWEAIRCLPQRNIYHRWPVDRHSLEAVVALTRFAPQDAGAVGAAPEPSSGIFRRTLLRRARQEDQSEGEEGQEAGGLGSAWDDLTRRVAADSRDLWDRLLLAALLHDIGKGADDDHSVRGEALARTAVEHMGFPPSEVGEIAWLVRHHLLLTRTAVRRNIDDESLVVELAESIGSVERLRALYLISVADGLATGSAAWTPWKATLVADLFTRVFHVLDRGELVSQRLSSLARARYAEIREALDGFPPEEVERHLSGMPRAWLLSQSTRALVLQSRVMLTVVGGRTPYLEARLLTEPDLWEVTVVAPDRPGLFSKVSGVLSLHGLNVLTAQVFTRSDGMALEVFRAGGTGERFDRVAADVEKALRGRISLDLRLDEKRRQYAGRVARGARQPPRVIVDNDASDFHTVIEVHATDRVGLLYDVTRALADLELDIHLAKVATYGEDVVDAFYVRDLDGQKVSDPEHVREIERTILHKLA